MPNKQKDRPKAPMTHKQKDEFLKRFKEVLGQRSQRQLARDLDELQQNVNRYTRGFSLPRVEFLLKLAARENIDLNWLLTGKTTAEARITAPKATLTKRKRGAKPEGARLVA